MTDFTTLKSWVEELGLRVKAESEGDGLELARPASGSPRFAIKPVDGTTWLIVHRRRLTLNSVGAQWSIGEETESPVQLLTKAICRMTTGFPMVQTEVLQKDVEVIIEFTATLLGEGLVGQTFGLTLSSIMKAVEAFDLLSERRTEQAAAWRKLTETEANLTKENVERLAELDAQTAKAAVPAASSSYRRKCPHCGIGMPEDALFCASCGERVMTAPSATPSPSAERRCARCGHMAPPGKNFCGGCGARL